MDFYQLDENNKPKRLSLKEFAATQNFEVSKKIKRTEIDKDTVVSTVFMFCGFDNPPRLFETMVFSKDRFNELTRRACTIEEALADHDLIVQDINESKGKQNKYVLKGAKRTICVVLDQILTEPRVKSYKLNFPDLVFYRGSSESFINAIIDGNEVPLDMPNVSNGYVCMGDVSTISAKDLAGKFFNSKFNVVGLVPTGHYEVELEKWSKNDQYLIEKLRKVDKNGM